MEGAVPQKRGKRYQNVHIYLAFEKEMKIGEINVGSEERVYMEKTVAQPY